MPPHGDELTQPLKHIFAVLQRTYVLTQFSCSVIRNDCFQRFIFVGADDRLVLVRAVPRHLPPAPRLRDGRLPESTESPLVRNSLNSEECKYVINRIDYFTIIVPRWQHVLNLSSVSWILAGLAAVPYLLFTTITLMVDDPPGSKNFIEESAICVLLPTNITPQVRKGKRNLECNSIFRFNAVCYMYRVRQQNDPQIRGQHLFWNP